MEDEAFAARFTDAMDCRGKYLAPAAADALDLREATRVLDVGGGSGIYACALAARWPHLKATVLEKAPVDRVASRKIAERGFAGRVEVAASDMFAARLPDGYDVHLFSNVLHDWDVSKVKELLRKSFEALAPGGLLAVHDAHLDATKSGPLEVAGYSVLIMHSSEGRCYSVTEMSDYCLEAGFAIEAFLPTLLHRSVFTARRPGGRRR